MDQKKIKPTSKYPLNLKLFGKRLPEYAAALAGTL